MTAGTTFAARMTPNGRGAVATIRVKGNSSLVDCEPALFHAANERPVSQQAIGRVVFGRWATSDSEEVVVCRLDESTLDIHCHGGEAAAARILRDLESRGCKVVDWRELVVRSEGMLKAELLEALSRATTARTAAIILEQQCGLLESSVVHLLSGTMSDARATVKRMLAWATFGLHLSTPWDVVLFGRPNVGKSSLINALVGYSRSIVYEEPGTTRDVVTAETAFEGWPIRLADTAGIRDRADVLEQAGIERARDHVAKADCRLLLIDTSRPPHPDDRKFLADFFDATVVAHKCDLPNVWGAETPANALSVSSLTGAGLEQLAHKIVSTVIPEAPPARTAIPVAERQIDLLRTALNAIDANDDARFRAALKSFLG